MIKTTTTTAIVVTDTMVIACRSLEAQPPPTQEGACGLSRARKLTRSCRGLILGVAGSSCWIRAGKVITVVQVEIEAPEAMLT